MKKKPTVGKDVTKLRKFYRENRDIILSGTVLAIDPGSRSMGLSVFKCGVCVDSGTLQVDGEILPRLNKLFHQLEDMYINPDIVVVETIRASMAHLYLQWSVGVLLAATNAPKLVEVNVNIWKKLVPLGYEKSDESDSYWIGRSLFDVGEQKV